MEALKASLGGAATEAGGAGASSGGSAGKKKAAAAEAGERKGPKHAHRASGVKKKAKGE
jgi:hypothetical protein